MSTKTKVVTVRLTEEQYAFFSEWQKKLESETGIEVPMGAILRRALEGFIQHYRHREGRSEALDPVQCEARKQASVAYVDDYQNEDKRRDP